MEDNINPNPEAPVVPGAPETTPTEPADPMDQLAALMQTDPKEYTRRIQEMAKSEAKQELAQELRQHLNSQPRNNNAAQHAADTIGHGMSDGARTWLAQELAGVDPQQLAAGLADPKFVKQARLMARGWEQESTSRPPLEPESVGNGGQTPLSTRDEGVVAAARRAFPGVKFERFLEELRGAR